MPHNLISSNAARINKSIALVGTIFQRMDFSPQFLGLAHNLLFFACVACKSHFLWGPEMGLSPCLDERRDGEGKQNGEMDDRSAWRKEHGEMTWCNIRLCCKYNIARNLQVIHWLQFNNLEILLSHTLKSGSFPRIEGASGNVSEWFHFHCQLALRKSIY